MLEEKLFQESAPSVKDACRMKRTKMSLHR